jgi:hypothetical protein
MLLVGVNESAEGKWRAINTVGDGQTYHGVCIRSFLPLTQRRRFANSNTALPPLSLLDRQCYLTLRLPKGGCVLGF